MGDHRQPHDRTRRSGPRSAGENASAPGRRSGLTQRRLVRTIVLGTLAVFAGLVWLARELDMDRDVLMEYAWTSLALVGAAVLAAMAGAALLWAVKRLFRNHR